MEKRKVQKKKGSVALYLKNHWQLYAMLVLPVVYMILFCYKPMLGVVVVFKKFSVFKGIWESPWVGFAHFQEAFSSKDFWSALKNTLVLNFGDLILGFPFPIFLTIFLNELRSNKIMGDEKYAGNGIHFLCGGKRFGVILILILILQHVDFMKKFNEPHVNHQMVQGPIRVFRHERVFHDTVEPLKEGNSLFR